LKYLGIKGKLLEFTLKRQEYLEREKGEASGAERWLTVVKAAQELLVLFPQLPCKFGITQKSASWPFCVRHRT
jgi:hypothetical protein